MSTTLHKDLTGADLHVNKEHTHVKAEITDFPVLIPGTGNGDVVGPASATDNAIVRADGVTGKLVQDSSVIIDDTGKVGIGTEQFTNDLLYPWATGGMVTTKVAIEGLKSGGVDLLSMVLLLLDSDGRPVAAFSDAGRMDLVDFSGRGAVAVLYNQGAAVNDELAGHYAFGARNSAGDMNTVAYISAYVSNIAATDMDSKMLFAIQAHKDTSAGYSQPNLGMTLDKDGLSIDGTLTVGGILISAAGLALIDDANAAAQLATLGLTPAYCSVGSSVNVSVVNNAEATIPFNSEVEDTTNMHSTVTNPERVVITSPGVYECVAMIRWNQAFTGVAQISLKKVGALIGVGYNAINPAQYDFQTVTAIDRFAANDYVVLNIYQNSSGAQELYAPDTTFKVVKISN